MRLFCKFYWQLEMFLAHSVSRLVTFNNIWSWFILLFISIAIAAISKSSYVICKSQPCIRPRNNDFVVVANWPIDNLTCGSSAIKNSRTYGKIMGKYCDLTIMVDSRHNINGKYCLSIISKTARILACATKNEAHTKQSIYKQLLLFPLFSFSIALR